MMKEDEEEEVEARTGLEPVNDDFADRSLTTWVPRQPGGTMPWSLGISQASCDSSLMTNRPESDPLGATPVLPAPLGNRSARPVSVSVAASKAERVYPAALSKVSGADEVADVLAGQAVDEGRVSPEDSLEARPPPFVPVVRSSVKPLDDDHDLPAALIAEGAASVTANPDGTAVFDIELDDAVLGPLRCQIQWQNGSVEALFLVQDRRLMRLLDGEMSRLRRGLEKRGINVQAVRVELAG
jgi:flagellar hook-length control protein FliK